MSRIPFKARPRFILVSDLDWTMVDHSEKDHNNLLAFNKLWQDRFANDSLLVFSTGRSHELYAKLREEVPLGNPDILVCSVGTEIFFEAAGSQVPEANQKWIALLDQGWNREIVVAVANKFSGLSLQEGSEQRPHKVSYHIKLKQQQAHECIEQLSNELTAQGLSVKVIYSGGEDLDILPAKASKGKGLEFLLKEIEEEVGSPRDGVLVNGDSGNDIELFQVPGVMGTMVSNAHPELREWVEKHPSDKIFKASQRCAGGIIEALNHFNLIPDES